MCAYSSAAQPALQVQVLQSACSAGCDGCDMVLFTYFSFFQFSLPDFSFSGCNQPEISGSLAVSQSACWYVLITSVDISLKITSSGALRPLYY